MGNKFEKLRTDVLSHNSSDQNVLNVVLTDKVLRIFATYHLALFILSIRLDPNNNTVEVM